MACVGFALGWGTIIEMGKESGIPIQGARGLSRWVWDVEKRRE